MGALVTQEYDISDAQEWSAYFERISAECRRLVGEGRMPDTEALDAFLADSSTLLHQVRRDVAAAKAKGATTAQSSVTLGQEDYKRMMSMRESVLNLLEILEIRGAVKLERTEGVARMVGAMTGGTFTP